MLWTRLEDAARRNGDLDDLRERPLQHVCVEAERERVRLVLVPDHGDAEEGAVWLVGVRDLTRG